MLIYAIKDLFGALSFKQLLVCPHNFVTSSALTMKIYTYYAYSNEILVYI